MANRHVQTYFTHHITHTPPHATGGEYLGELKKNNLELQASTYIIVAIKMFIYHT